MCLQRKSLSLSPLVGFDCSPREPAPMGDLVLLVDRRTKERLGDYAQYVSHASSHE